MAEEWKQKSWTKEGEQANRELARKLSARQFGVFPRPRPNEVKNSPACANCLSAALLQPPSDARLVQIVRRHLHLHPVAGGQTHEAFAHLAADGREDEVF